MSFNGTELKSIM